MHVIAVFFCSIFVATSSYAGDLNIYLDADRTHHKESAQAIELGIKSALRDLHIPGYKVHYILKDHRGNAKRSYKHMREFLTDPDALIFFGGVHSPPYIKYRDFINDNEILTLIPWAAGGPITRAKDDNNWIFRLSVDDTKAGKVMINYALNSKQCQNPELVLEKTPWGESNFKNIKAELDKKNIITSTTWFNWTIDQNKSNIMIQDIAANKHDCIILVANALDGTKIVRSIHQNQPNIKVISHWGITAGEFLHKIGKEAIENIDLNFIQSCFSYLNTQNNNIATEAFTNAKSIQPSLNNPEEINSASGFVHAYDLGLLLKHVLTTNKPASTNKEYRKILKHALENINQDIPGILKTYNKPFTAYSPNNPNAHEALDANDLCMGKYNSAGQILVDESR